MRFDVRLPSPGQDRQVWMHGRAESLCTSNIQMLCTLLTFIRVVKIKRLMKSTFFKVGSHDANEWVALCAAWSSNHLRYTAEVFELDNKNTLSGCYLFICHTPLFTSLWLSSYTALLPSMSVLFAHTAVYDDIMLKGWKLSLLSAIILLIYKILFKIWLTISMPKVHLI